MSGQKLTRQLLHIDRRHWGMGEREREGQKKNASKLSTKKKATLLFFLTRRVSYENALPILNYGPETLVQSLSLIETHKSIDFNLINDSRIDLFVRVRVCECVCFVGCSTCKFVFWYLI